MTCGWSQETDRPLFKFRMMDSRISGFGLKTNLWLGGHSGSHGCPVSEDLGVRNHGIGAAFFVRATSTLAGLSGSYRKKSGDLNVLCVQVNPGVMRNNGSWGKARVNRVDESLLFAIGVVVEFAIAKCWRRNEL